MGTRSRLTITYKGQVYYYWMHWDGYLSGVGNSLCQGLCKLLKEYSLSELRKMVEALSSGDHGMTEGHEIYELITKGNYYRFDESDDFEFSYNLDFDVCVLVANEAESQLGFGQIRTGTLFVAEDDEVNKAYVQEQDPEGYDAWLAQL